MLVCSLRIYCVTASLNIVTHTPRNHGEKTGKHSFECIRRVRVYSAADFPSISFCVYSETLFFYFFGNLFCSSVFGVRVYLAPFECIWQPFERIWSGSSVFGTRRIHSNGFRDGSSVFGEMRECIWRIRVYLARECIWRGGAPKNHTIYKVFVKSEKRRSSK